jgi:hypothetical protein
MTYNFGDSFDLYKDPADAAPAYWDSGTTTSFSVSNAGRFGGRALSPLAVNNSVLLVKSSGQNDAIHHIVVAWKFVATMGAANLVTGFTLSDGVTAQCSIVFSRDGSIVLTSGAMNSGTTLATYTGAYADNTNWYAYEFEIQIHNTVGSFKVRKNGATSDSFAATNLNTRVSANNYANKLTIANGPQGVGGGGTFDDLYWRSHATSVAWMGDLRCYVRTPKSDIQAQFAPSGVKRATVAAVGGQGPVANRAWYSNYIAPCDGLITGLAINILATTYPGDLKGALFTDNVSNPGTPGTVLASATNIITPGANQGVYTFLFSPPISVVNQQLIWSGISANAGVAPILFSGSNPAGQPIGYFSDTLPYASFPVSNPSTLSNNQSIGGSLLITPANSGCVLEAPHDALSTYVFDANVGDNDLYSVLPITAIPVVVIAATTRVCARKSDIGARTVTAQLKSGSTIVNSPALTLSNTAWGFAWRIDIVNPDNGLAWGPADIDALQLGPVVSG